MIAELKRLVVGRPLATEQLAHERLSKRIALAVFSSDALSSVAYATEAILIALLAAGQQSLGYATPISIGIALLLITVAFSYRQTIIAYPQGGGTYIVSRENLGTIPSLVAASSLLIDYILTVAVSMSAGVAAITSAIRSLEPYRIELAITLIALVTLANLRGIKESGQIFAIPTYLFIAGMFVLIGTGLFQVVTGQAAPAPPPRVADFPAQLHPLTFFLILRAFAAGCTALTGIEAISDGVPAFKKPESRNAAMTLVVMAALLTTMFLGTSVLAYLYGVHPHASETVISQFARIMFTGPLAWFYYVVQIATALILVLAANTSFADFPRLGSLLARDRFLPRQFATRGDKLVFSNGIVMLAIFASILVVAFGGVTIRLIPLYAVGVFLSFTLSQSGMVRHWLKVRAQSPKKKSKPRRRPEDDIHFTQSTVDREPLPDAELVASEERGSTFITDEVTDSSHWKKSIVINAVGAVATFIVLCVFIATKFIHGAWIVVVVVPLLVFMFRAIHKHYVGVAKQLSTEGLEELRPIRHTVIVPISGIHRGVVGALQYAKSIAPDHVQAVYVDFDEEATAKLREKWERWGAGVKLVVLPSPYLELTRPLLRYIARLERKNDNDMVTVLLPEFVPAKWWQHLLHNQSSLMLKGALLFKEGVIVISLHYHLKR